MSAQSNAGEAGGAGGADDAIVVGGSIADSSIAYHLVCQGVKTLKNSKPILCI
ncbi:hypothetical protein [Coleofasciculus sp. F4-SAH-05]|uniref:hypothetical protein n=1 Tax=Coleofasciculus sp. F4-SAH-05 TaxID=3069525 RepID=UPI0033051174